MITPHEEHEAKRQKFHDEMQALNPHRKFITNLCPGEKEPRYIWLDNPASVSGVA